MFTKNTFKCDRYCGKCCKILAVRVDEEDIAKIKGIGFEEAHFIERDFIDESKFVLKKSDNGNCIFLKTDKKGRYSCAIHKYRPKICQKYPFLNSKPIKSCYPEDMFPTALFSFKSGRFVAINQ